MEPHPHPLRSHSMASSLVSTPSSPRHASSPSTTSAASSRPTSYTPSYMNAPVSPRQPSGRSSPTSAAAPKAGLLLVVVADLPDDRLLGYLETLLKRTAYARIGLVGPSSRERELQGVKMSLFGLLGRLAQEVHVKATVQPALHISGARAALDDILSGPSEAASVEPLRDILCCLAYTAPDPPATEVLSIPQEALLAPWDTSTALLHAVAQVTVPLLRAAACPPSEPALLIVTDPHASSASHAIARIHRAGVDALFATLAQSCAAGASPISFVHAEPLLSPAAPAPPPKSRARTPLTGAYAGKRREFSCNGDVKALQLRLAAGGPDRDGERDDGEASGPPESPTKLWGMWALSQD